VTVTLGAGPLDLATVEEQLLARWPETKIEPSLDRIHRLLEFVGDPQRSYRAVHLTGTNGKTSTARMVESLLMACGEHTGRLTSPHLTSIRERIAITGQPVDASAFVAAYVPVALQAECVDAIMEHPLSFFELTVAMGYRAFADAAVDVAVVEVGMGGRWDATNVIDADVAVILPIDLDHTDYLGPTTAAIAHEKAGIIKPGAVAVSSRQIDEVAAVLRARADAVGAHLLFLGTDFSVESRTPVDGRPADHGPRLPRDVRPTSTSRSAAATRPTTPRAPSSPRRRCSAARSTPTPYAARSMFPRCWSPTAARSPSAPSARPYELGARTVAVFPYEDRWSEHRLKADEAYEIGERGHPVRAYLDPEAIVDVAVRAGADAVYPGYGFLSENPRWPRPAPTPGSPSSAHRRGAELTGNKARAIAAAKAAGVPTLQSVEPSTDVDALVAAAEAMPLPALRQGGRRRWRPRHAPGRRPGGPARGDRDLHARGRGRVRRPDGLHRAGRRRPAAHRGADPRRRRGQRDPPLRARLLGPAPAPEGRRDRPGAQPRPRAARADVRRRGAVRPRDRLRNAGTVEFLLDPEGNYVFIEMNPRIQVEHTVTEEVTDVDLVQSQLRIASGETLADLGLSQDTVRLRGAALQCRITTEDPANDFRPTPARSRPTAPRRRRASASTAARLHRRRGLPHFDSMLAKLTCRGRDLRRGVEPGPAARWRSSASAASDQHPVPAGGARRPGLPRRRRDHVVHRDHPSCSPRGPAGGDRGTKLLGYLADVTVNQPHGERRPARPGHEAPAARPRRARPRRLPAAAARARARGFAAALREQRRVAVTDTTFRDAHQSLLATRVRTRDLLAVAGHVARTHCRSCGPRGWGGATYDVALRFLAEDPWERLAALREAVPNVCLQMLLRGRNTVGYTPYPTEVTDAFVEEAAATGIDVFRIFDALNDVEQMRPAIEAVRETGTRVAEVALCYTGDLSDPGEKLYTLDYYLRLAEQIVDAGAHVLAIKDMAGLLRAPAAARWSPRCASEFDLPVHLHTHDTPGGQLATLLAAIDAGRRRGRRRERAMAGTTSSRRCRRWSRPPTTPARDRPRPRRGARSSPTGRPPAGSTRRSSPGLPRPTGRVYTHEIPGGQLSNLRQQAIALGLGEKFEQIEDMYAAANDILGNMVKVTPSSKVVGDLALHLVAVGADPAEFEANPGSSTSPTRSSASSGELGDPPGRLARAVPHQGARGPQAKPAQPSSPTADARRAGHRPPRHAQPAAVPRPDREFRVAASVRRPLGAADLDYLYGLRPAPSTRSTSGPGKRC
jgi:pyruvate carboxylase